MLTDALPTKAAMTFPHSYTWSLPPSSPPAHQSLTPPCFLSFNVLTHPPSLPPFPLPFPSFPPSPSHQLVDHFSQALHAVRLPHEVEEGHLLALPGLAQLLRAHAMRWDEMGWGESR